MALRTTNGPVNGAETKRLRKEKKLTQQQLADIAEISAPTVQRIERSDETVTRPMMVRVARVLGVPLDAIYDDPVEMIKTGLSDAPDWFLSHSETLHAHVEDANRQLETLRQAFDQQSAQLDAMHLILRTLARKR